MGTPTSKTSSTAKARRRADPFAAILNQAADRLYLKPVWLGDDLVRDASRTLHTISAKPEAFGVLKSCHDAEARRLRIEHLLTAARAYVNNLRKNQPEPRRQLDLCLPKPRA